MRVFFSTGEVSGDMVGARLAGRLREQDPSATLFGIGGTRMAAAGVEVIVPANHLGTVGVTEALSALPSLAGILAAIRRRIRATRPDVAILIGNDVFNTLLSRWLRRRGIPTVSYFPPQVWIWRGVARFIARSFDAILTSFPEEQAVYARASTGSKTAVVFVGHYLGETLARRTPSEVVSCRRRLGLGGPGRVVGLLPGSRSHEIRQLAARLFDAAVQLREKDPKLRFLVPVAEPEYRERIEAAIRERGLAEHTVVTTDSRDAMRASDLVLLASGTASLEAALLGVPMVILYAVSSLTVGVVRFVIRLGLIESETIGLPNLLLGREVVPELRQSQATAAALAAEAWSLLADDTRREAMSRALAEVGARIHAVGTVDRVVATAFALACGSAGVGGDADFFAPPLQMANSGESGARRRSSAS
ncbi:MAG: lipid-A-disaccharide synthase [Thermoanaerobaculales bacterium]